jgi:NADH-quinone oxidoreductase subunit D
MYCFRERERILDMFEMLCGARITVSYMRPGGVTQDAPPEFWDALAVFTHDMPGYIDDLEGLITGNEVVLARTRDVGILTDETAVANSVTGPMLRASGVQWDLRKADPYEIYDRVEFDVPIGATGDTFDRYIVRIQEMRESVRIIRQCVEQIPDGPVREDAPFFMRPPAGDAYATVEAPKGELGFYLVSDGGIAPYRCKIRAPSFINMNVLRELLVGWKMGDLIIIFGSTDIVMGEVDR